MEKTQTGELSFGAGSKQEVILDSMVKKISSFVPKK